MAPQAHGLEPQAHGLDPAQFRKALGRYVTGVTVIAARDKNGKLAGLTANSFASVSLDPPLVLWSLRKKSSLSGVFVDASHFVISVLAQDQLPVARQLSAAAEDRFLGVAWQPGRHSGLPILDGCAAWFECENAQCHDAGDHNIFIGKVLDFSHQDLKPLVFESGRYAASISHPALSG